MNFASHPLFANGAYHIVPAFFEFVLHLNATERDFALVFRTMGENMPVVADEWNMFCTGRHPLYPSAKFDGSNNTIDRRLHLPQASGVFHRTSIKSDGIYFSSICPNQNTVDIAKGAAACDAAIYRLIGHGYNTLGIRDDYKFWGYAGYTDDSGKLCLVERAVPGGCVKRHVLFFDDNIRRAYAHIVDVRDHVTGEHIPFAEANGVYLHRARPVDIVLDNQYFVKALTECESALATIEAGASSVVD